MQNDPRFFNGKGTYPYPFEEEAVAGSLKKHGFPCSPKGVEFQPTKACPKNIVIYDHSETRSRIMFNPNSNFDIDKYRGKGQNESSSSFKEDSEDIDALLGSEGEGEDDEVSTGRYPGNWGGGSMDSSCSSSVGRTSQKSTGSSNARRKERTRKMVKKLKGILPGGERMDTPAVLDEAVKYLKSLKMEAEKLGLQNTND